MQSYSLLSFIIIVANSFSLKTKAYHFTAIASIPVFDSEQQKKEKSGY